MNDLDNLYRQVIMDHYKNPRNKGLADSDEFHLLHLKNPSCGDDINIQVKIVDDKIEDIRQDGTGCSICCSSASVMTEVLKGKTVEEANKIIEDFYGIIKGEDPIDEQSLDEAIVFQGVSKYPARVKCATLAWKACGAILAGERGEKSED